MSAEQRLSLPKSVFDADDPRGDADVLASEHVITFDRRKVAFFHEAFFDYSFARGWVAGGHELMAWLLDGDQELRGQVRQILTHLRDIEPARFTGELRACLNDERVRVHLKDVMLSLLASLPSPSRADWELVTELLDGDGWVSGRAWSLLRSEPWSVRTGIEGVLAEWFVSRDPKLRARAVDVARAGASGHGDGVAELLATLADPTEAAQAVRIHAMTRDDLERPDVGELEWSVAARSESVSRVFAHATGLAVSAEDWYARKRRSKRRWGRALRMGAILLGGVAAVLPIVSEIAASDKSSTIPPGWASVALALAALLVALDHYFGFSAAWMRFMAAELRLTRLRHDFEYEWQVLASAAAIPPTDSELAGLLESARRFVLAVNDVLADETHAWVAEFRTTLERADQELGRSGGS